MPERKRRRSTAPVENVPTATRLTMTTEPLGRQAETQSGGVGMAGQRVNSLGALETTPDKNTRDSWWSCIPRSLFTVFGWSRF